MPPLSPPLVSLALHAWRQVMMLIAHSPPPTLSGETQASYYLHDFIAQALNKDPATRPTASELLEHPLPQRATEHGLVYAISNLSIYREEVSPAPRMVTSDDNIEKTMVL